MKNQITNEDEKKLAKQSLKTLRRKKLKRKSKIRLKIDEGEEIIIPNKAFDFLKQFLESMSEGDPVSLLANDEELTTQEAANILKVSRPHLIKLLETGKIPFLKVGTHRRILLKDIQIYREELLKEQSKYLAELSQLAQEDNLGY